MGEFLASVNHQISENLRYVQNLKQQQAAGLLDQQNQTATTQNQNTSAAAMQSMMGGMDMMQMILLMLLMDMVSRMGAPPPAAAPGQNNAAGSSALSADLLKAMFAPSLSQPAPATVKPETTPAETEEATDTATAQADNEVKTEESGLQQAVTPAISPQSNSEVDLSGATAEELASAEKAIAWLTDHTTDEPSDQIFVDMQTAFIEGRLGFSELGVMMAIMLQSGLGNPETDALAE